MNWLRRVIVNRRLEKSLRPDPQYRKRRLAQFPPDRVEKYRLNVVHAGLPDPLR